MPNIKGRNPQVNYFLSILKKKNLNSAKTYANLFKTKPNSKPTKSVLRLATH